MDEILGKYTDLDALSPKIEQSYIQWVQRNNSVAPNNSERLYFQNIVNLYQQSKGSSSEKTDFEEFVQNIKFLFEADANYDRIHTLDFDDAAQVRTVLPIIVGKLKEIIAYYRRKRQGLRNDKTRLFLNGTSRSVEIAASNLFHDLGGKSPDPANDFSSHSLSSLKVEYQQLYDFYDYFNSTDETYVRNFEVLSKNPIFFRLVDYLNQNMDAELSDYSVQCGQGDAYAVEERIDLTQKYSSCFVEFLSGFEKVHQDYPYTLDLKRGDNTFFWISGENFYSKSDQAILATTIHDLDWSRASAGSEIGSSDIIFVNGPEGKKAAWLKRYDKEQVDDVMVADLTDQFEFRFPFPSHGLSGEGFSWTGAAIRETGIDLQQYYGELYDTINDSVATLYWQTPSLGISSSMPILVNDTTLVESGAFPSDNYDDADKMMIRPKSTDAIFDGVYNDEVENLWLYDFRETEIPITPGKNRIYWPLGRFNDVSELFFEYKWGDPIPLSSVDVAQQMVGAIASDSISSADKLYRLKTYCGPAIECAWLKGIPLSSLNAFDRDGCNCDSETLIVPTKRRYRRGTVQSHTYFKTTPNAFTPFNLSSLGENATINLNDVETFKGKKHDPTCRYTSLKLNDLYNVSKFTRPDVDTNQWKQCQCGAIIYSPFGHRGSSFHDYGAYTDFIVKHTTIPKPFSFKTWVGSDGKNYLTSDDFAWFRLQDSPDQNIGWGVGKWVTGSGNEMVLNPHDQYLYYRSSIDRCEGYDAPFSIVKRSSCKCDYVDENCEAGNCTPVWMKAEQDETGAWVDSGVVSDMVLESNHFYDYDHQAEHLYSTERLMKDGAFITSQEYVEIPVNSEEYAFDEYQNISPGMNFIWNCPINNARPFWTNTVANLSSTMKG